jgi:GNAT superfamily N-acetyltransferase
MMAHFDSGAIEFRLLHEGDLPAALRLGAQEHWNQTHRDWRRLLALEPGGCFAASLDGRLIGTVTSVTYGAELAWIGMMLVDADHRRRGIGTRLMRMAMEYLERLGVATIKLDATPAGRPVYESLGFTVETRIDRWVGVARPSPTTGLRVVDEQTRGLLYAFDLIAFGTDRRRLIDRLIADAFVPPMAALEPSGTTLRGYVLVRGGAEAVYVGPVIATDAATAGVLLDGTLSQLAGERLLVDVSCEFDTGSQMLADRGFVKQRELTRMRCGTESGAGTSRMILATGGPELG